MVVNRVGYAAGKVGSLGGVAVQEGLESPRCCRPCVSLPRCPQSRQTPKMPPERSKRLSRGVEKERGTRNSGNLSLCISHPKVLHGSGIFGLTITILRRGTGGAGCLDWQEKFRRNWLKTPNPKCLQSRSRPALMAEAFKNRAPHEAREEGSQGFG